MKNLRTVETGVAKFALAPPQGGLYTICADGPPEGGPHTITTIGASGMAVGLAVYDPGAPLTGRFPHA
jgi:hypothetical protein